MVATLCPADRPRTLAAFRYATLGYPVLPCLPGGKEPLAALVPHGCLDATTDPETISHWWTVAPDANVAIATTGLVVIDVDPGAPEEWRAEDFYAPTVRTPRGGRHYYLTSGRPRRCSVAKIAPHVDIRADGGYVLAPPSSVHGKRYEWLPGFELPALAELPPIPPWLSQHLDRSETPPQRADGSDSSPILEGTRNGRLTSMAGAMRRAGFAAEQIAAALHAVNAARCVPPLPAADVECIAESVGRYQPDPELLATIITKGRLPDVTPPAPDGTDLGTLLSAVTPERVEWLWPARIPFGKLTILDGDPGLGKSVLTLDVAARLTRGFAMPRETTASAPAGVVLLSAEDGLADTIRPRLDAAGADVGRILALDRIPDGQGGRLAVLPADVTYIAAACRRVEARLIIIDPLAAFLGAETNAHKDQDVRRALYPLSKLAEETGAAVVVVRHLNKAAGGNPVYRGGGSIGIIGAARSGLLVARDPDNPDKRVLAATKCNLACLPASLSFELAVAPNGLRIQWLGEAAHTAESLLAAPPDETDRNAVTEAAQVLRAILVAGPLPADEVKKQARQAGVADATLRRAKSLLRVQSSRVGGLGAEGAWRWSMPLEPIRLPPAAEPTPGNGNAPAKALSDPPPPQP